MKNNKKIVNVTTIFVIMIIIITIWQCFKIVDTPLKIKDEEIIEVAEGDSFYGVLNKLSEEDKIKNEFLVKLYLKIRGIKPEVLAGTYKLDKSMTLDEIITLLSNDSTILLPYIFASIKFIIILFIVSDGILCFKFSNDSFKLLPNLISSITFLNS